MNLDTRRARDLVGRPVHDSRGEHVGDVGAVYFDGADRCPAWISLAFSLVEGWQVFVPAGDLRPENDHLALPFDQETLALQPLIDPHDGRLSNAQVARLHEFFHTYDGHTRITGATVDPPGDEPEPLADAPVPFTGRGHEPAFGTGEPGAGEPHDVTLQGNGNFAP